MSNMFLVMALSLIRTRGGRRSDRTSIKFGLYWISDNRAMLSSPVTYFITIDRRCKKKAAPILNLAAGSGVCSIYTLILYQPHSANRPSTTRHNLAISCCGCCSRNALMRIGFGYTAATKNTAAAQNGINDYSTIPAAVAGGGWLWRRIVGEQSSRDEQD